MKRYLLRTFTTLTLLSFMVFSFSLNVPFAQAALARVQSTTGADLNFNSSVTTLAFASPLTNPSLILCGAEYDAGTLNSGTTPTDTATNTYTRILSKNVAGTFELELWYAENTHTTSNNQVTFTDTNGGVRSTAVCEEWTGADTSSPLDGSNASSTAPQISLLVSGAFSAAQQNDILYEVGVVPNAAGNMSLAGAFTNLVSTTTSSSKIADATQALTTPAGQQNGVLTIANAASWAMGMVAIKPATANTKTETVFTSSGTWTAPAGVTSVNVDAWAGGGGGGLGTSASGGGSGGGGGAYSGLTNFVTTPGNNYPITVGSGGVGSTGTNAASGTDSMFNASSSLLAKGGGPGKDVRGIVGAGGNATQGNGDTKHTGGGGLVGVTTGSTGDGGPGGGAAGTTADGSAGTAASGTARGGIGGATGSGTGGSGQNTGTGGAAGFPDGGGGAGGGASGAGTAGGPGGAGEVDITYTTPTTTSVNDDSGWWNLMTLKDNDLQLV